MTKPRSQKNSGKRLHGVGKGNAASSFESVYGLVRQIPVGRVATYGQISNLMGNLLSPLAVGWALHSCPDGVPWQRVVNAAGALSTERLPDIPPGLQRAMLESEGVAFGDDDTIDLDRYRWVP
jgi:methylated-DNA-protein-cysteine methyltransferase-like protein